MHLQSVGVAPLIVAFVVSFYVNCGQMDLFRFHLRMKCLHPQLI